MRFALALSTLALAASSVQAWLPPLLSPQAGEVYKNGDNLTITWDTSSYNSSADAQAKFFLGYKSTDGSGSAVTVVAQFAGNQGTEGSWFDLWGESNSVTLTVDVASSISALGQPVWVVVEYPLNESQETGLFTVEA